MTSEIITGLLTLIGTVIISWLAHRRAMFKMREEAAAAKEKSRQGRRELEAARAEARVERVERMGLTISIAKLSAELDAAESKCQRMEEFMLARGITRQQLAGVVTGMAPLGDPEV